MIAKKKALDRQKEEIFEQEKKTWKNANKIWSKESMNNVKESS